MLFSGTIILVNNEHRSIPARIGQKISSSTHSYIKITPGSKLYLQKGRKLLKLESEGVFKLDDIGNKSGTLFSNAMQFLAALSTPRNFTQQARARGNVAESPQNDSAFFNRIWTNIALNRETTKAISSEDILAASAWYYQQNTPARTAYMLEHLDHRTQPRNPFFHQLRNDSLRGVPLAGISAAVEETRAIEEGRRNQFRYKALLIGINQYDHPAWQPLDHPIADIRSLQSLFIDNYRFQPEDIMTLENPTFSEVINGFHALKKTVDNQTRLVIYFAGHGYYPADEEEGYWIPRNGGDPASQRFFIPTSIILSKMKAIKSRQTLLITDSCFSGSLIRKPRGGIVDSGFYRELSEKKSRQIITSGGLEPVSDSGGGNHSVFAGNLIQILSEKRNTPLSASELAIELRKTLKNRGARQTPEYGRLYAAGDDNGEFFFVRRDQSLVFAENQRITVQPELEKPEAKSELDIIGMRNPPENDGSAFQVKGEENWLEINLMVHRGFMEYNYKYEEAGEDPRTINLSTSLQGTGLKAEYRRTDYKGGYGAYFDFGQFASITTCANDDNALSNIGIRTCEEDDSEDNLKSSVNGYFTHLGVFSDYSVLVWREISVQLGGAIQYQYYDFDNFLEKSTLNSSTMGACGKCGVTYRNNGWATRIFFDFCLSTFEFSGSLHELDEDHASNVRLLAGMSFGLTAGYQF